MKIIHYYEDFGLRFELTLQTKNVFTSSSLQGHQELVKTLMTDYLKVIVAHLNEQNESKLG